MRSWVGGDRANLVRIGLDGALADDMTEKSNLCGGELTLLAFDVEVGFVKLLEDTTHFGEVVGERAGGGDEKVVDVDTYGLTKVSSLDPFDELLEGCGSVGETERHTKVFEKTFLSDEGSALLTVLGHRNVVVGILDVEGSDPVCVFAKTEDVFDARNGVGVLLGLGVEFAIVDTHAHLSAV